MAAPIFGYRGFDVEETPSGWVLTRVLTKGVHGPFPGDKRGAMAQVDRLVEEWLDAVEVIPDDGDPEH